MCISSHKLCIKQRLSITIFLLILTTSIHAVELTYTSSFEFCTVNCDSEGTHGSMSVHDGKVYTIVIENDFVNQIRSAVVYDILGGERFMLDSTSFDEILWTAGPAGEYFLVKKGNPQLPTLITTRYQLSDLLNPFSFPNEPTFDLHFDARRMNKSGAAAGWFNPSGIAGAGSYDLSNDTLYYYSPANNSASANDISEDNQYLVGGGNDATSFLKPVAWQISGNSATAGEYLDLAGGTSGKANFIDETTLHAQTIMGIVDSWGGYWAGLEGDFVPLVQNSNPIAALPNGLLLFGTSGQGACTGWSAEHGFVNLGALIDESLENSSCYNAAYLASNENVYVMFLPSAGRVVVHEFSTLSLQDTDTDGVQDSIDNCTIVANANQTDTDADGYGNACDPDFNNDCTVNFGDISSFVDEFLGVNPLFDLNNDDAINFADFSRVTSSFLQSPGPGLGGC